MAAPAGYTELGRIGFVDRGTYASGTTYRIGDVVYYNGSTWSALKDNLKGVTPATGANWKYMARGFAAEALSAVTAKDTSGVLGTAGASVTSQALVDAIADKVMTKLIEKSKIVNNLLATDASTVLSGPMGKSLDEKIGGVISDLTVKDVTAHFYKNAPVSYVLAYKIGHMVQCIFTISAGSSGWVEVAFCDDDVRPLMDVPVYRARSTIADDNAIQVNGTLKAAENKLYIYISKALSTNLSMSCIYPTTR